MILLFLGLATCAAAENQTYYLDVRWDNVESYAANPTTIPYNHGLRILPAIYLAREKLEAGLELVPTPSSYSFNESYYYEYVASKMEEAKKFGLRNLSDSWSNVGPKDVGECSRYTSTCQVGEDYARFKRQKFIADGDYMNFELPKAGVNYSDADYFTNMLKETEGMTGILGSTDGAAIAAKVARARQFPHIVPHITDSMGMWPLGADETLASSELDNSLIVGFDSFQIQDIIHEIIREGLESKTPGSMQNYSIQIIHEGGHNRVLANKLVEGFSDRLKIQLSFYGSDSAYAIPEILLTETNYYTYGLEDNENSGDRLRMTSDELDTLVKQVKKRGRFVILMGKRAMFRGILAKFHDEGMDPADYQIILIPENGGPCTLFWEKQGAEDNSRDNDIKAMLQDQMAICHNGHNRNWLMDTWNEDKDAWERPRPPAPSAVGNMTKWDAFSADFRRVAAADFNYTVPADEEISHLAALAHDSVIWAAFLNTQRIDLPHWFYPPDGTGKYSQNRFFQPKMNSFDALKFDPPGVDVAYKSNLGWANMFGGWDMDDGSKTIHQNSTDNMITGCCGQVAKNSFADNAFSYRRNRIMGDALGVTVFTGTKWAYTRKYSLSRKNENYYGLLLVMTKAESMTWRDVSRPLCDYDGSLCSAQEQAKQYLVIIIVAIVVLFIGVTFCGSYTYKKMKYRKAVGAMMWRLDYDSIDFDVAGAGIRSSMLGGGTQGTMGTVGTMGTIGTMGTMGNATVQTMGNTQGLNTKGTMGTQGTAATFQTLGTNMTGVSDAGKKNQVFAKLAVHHAKRCAVKDLDDDWSTLCTKTPTFTLLQEMKEVTDLINDNIVNFLGICYTDAMDHPVCLMEYCTRGSLQDLLEDDEVTLDNNFKFSFIIDLIKGMRFLHSTAHIKSHGYLKSTNCLITAQFGLKIGDYGEVLYRSDTHRVSSLEKIARDNRKLSQAPELLRLAPSDVPIKGTKAADIYSIGVIIHEIIERKGPYGTSSDDCMMSAGEILEMIVTPPYGRPFRPNFTISDNDKIQVAKAIADSCWQENPTIRPNIFHLENETTKLQDEDLSLAQRMIRRMERFVRDMERLKKSYESTKENNVTIYRKLQQELLPKTLIEKITVGQDTPPENHTSTSVLSLHITGLYEALRQSPDSEGDIWTIINHLNNSVSGLIKSKGFFKLRCDMEKFLIIANAREACDNHPTKIYDFVDEFRFFVQQSINLEPHLKKLIQIKAGICTGPLTTVVLRGKFPRLQAYGETLVVAEALRECATDSLCLVADSTQNQLSMRKNIKFEKWTSVKHKDLRQTAVYSATSI